MYTKAPALSGRGTILFKFGSDFSEYPVNVKSGQALKEWSMYVVFQLPDPVFCYRIIRVFLVKS